MVVSKKKRAPAARRVLAGWLVAISGEHEYRIRGNRGTVHYLGFFTQKGNYGQGRGMPPTGYLEASDMEIEPDGQSASLSVGDPLEYEDIEITSEEAGGW